MFCVVCSMYACSINTNVCTMPINTRRVHMYCVLCYVCAVNVVCRKVLWKLPRADPTSQFAGQGSS